MLVKTVATILTTNSAGQVVESLPVLPTESAYQDTAGRWQDPIPMVEDPLGTPIRIVSDAVVLNSAGKPVAAARGEGVGWWTADALVDLDLSGARAFYAGQATSLAAFLSAYDGAQVGQTITISPKVVGAELIADPAFDGGIAGWVNGATFESLGTLSWDGANKRLHANIPTRTGGSAVQFRCSIPVAVTISKAYRYQIRTAQEILNGSGNTAFNTANAFGGKGVTGARAAGELISDYSQASVNPMYLSLNTNSGSVSRADEYWDDQSVQEVVPLVGHNYQALSGVVEGVTPAAASGDKVAFQADTNDERNRVRLAWDANKHLRLVVTNNATEVANLDLGVVEVSTAIEVRFSCTTNSFKASLDGGVVVSDTAGNHPGLSHVRIGRSFTGETWDGTISRITLFADVMSDAEMTDPLKAFMVFGDSTANGDGSGVTTKWYDALRTAYTPDRSVAEAAQGGENTTQTLARVAADTDHRRWTTIFMDRPNTGESSATWLANMKAAVAYLETDRWLIVPPVLNSPSGQPDSAATAIGEVQAALLSDPFFAGHTFDADEQAAYIAEMNDDATRVSGDWVHFNDAGQALQAARIKATLDASGW